MFTTNVTFTVRLLLEIMIQYVEDPLCRVTEAYNLTAAWTIIRGEMHPTCSIIQPWDVDENLSSRQTIIAPFFKPLAYSLILLRSQGQPCIFYGDLYGINGGPEPQPGPSCSGRLPILTRARKLYAHGEQRDYFNRRNCIGQYGFCVCELLVLTFIQDSCATGAINTHSVLLVSSATVERPTSACLLVTDMLGNCGQIFLTGEMRRYSLITAAMEFSQSPLWVLVSGWTL